MIVGIKIYITYFIYTETMWLAKAKRQILVADKPVLRLNKNVNERVWEWGVTIKKYLSLAR